MSSPSLTVILPAYNEEAALGAVLNQLHENVGNLIREIIVVDDGSTDSTAQVAEKAGVRVIRHSMNLGYGASLKTGIKAAKSDFILTMDADGQHLPENIPQLWAFADSADMVVGSRQGLLHSPWWRMPGKWLLRLLGSYLVKRRIPDLNSGLRLMKREIALKYLHLCPSGFSFSTTVTLAYLTRGYNVIYVPIMLNKRVGKSTVTLVTGWDTIILILRIASLFNPLRVFVPISILCVAIGLTWAIPYAIDGHGVSVGSMLAIVTGVLLFGFGLVCDQVSQLRLERFE